MSDPATRSRRPAGPVARLLVLLMLLMVVAAALPGWTVPAAHAAGDPVVITLETLSPGLARAGTDLLVIGTLRNVGAENLRNVEVRLRMSDSRLNSRAELAAVAEGRTSSRDGDVIASQSLPDLDSEASVGFDLSRPLDELDTLTEFGVYVLGVEVLASRPAGFGRVAILRTLLPWVPEQADFSPTGFSWLWPLVAHPTRLADDTFADDSLAAELEPGGRLSRLLEAGLRLGQGAGLTWAVDPELLDAVAVMADEANPYQVRAPDGSLAPGVGSALAISWLAQLRAATLDRPVLALPYGDPDLTAVTRAGLGGDVARAREQGHAVVEAALPLSAVLLETVWPVDGFTNRDTLRGLRHAGVTTVVLDGRAVPTVIDLSYTPSGRAQIETRAGRLIGLLAEPGLADQLRDRGTDPLLAAQRLLAETAMITSELPSTGTERKILVMPPRRWDPSPEYLDRLVEVVAAAPWMAPVSLSDLASDEPPEVDRDTLSYPKAQRAEELPAPYLSALQTMHSSINLFSGILTDQEQLIPGLNRSVLLLESTWWRGRDDARANRSFRERGYLADLRGSVRVQPGSFTFSSRRGTIPLTVANGLDQDVVVELRLDPQTIQLRLTKPNRLVPVGPQQKEQVQVEAVAVAGGEVLVDATLHTPSGVPYGQPVQLQVSITEYGTVALYITVAAATVLFVTAGIRVLRRLLATRGTRAEPAGEPDPEDIEDPPAPATAATEEPR